MLIFFIGFDFTMHVLNLALSFLCSFCDAVFVDHFCFIGKSNIALVHSSCAWSSKLKILAFSYLPYALYTCIVLVLHCDLHHISLLCAWCNVHFINQIHTWLHVSAKQAYCVAPGQKINNINSFLNLYFRNLWIHDKS